MKKAEEFDQELFIEVIKNICKIHNVNFIQADFDTNVNKTVISCLSDKVERKDTSIKMKFEMEFNMEPELKKLKP